MIMSLISAILSVQVLYQGVHGLANIYRINEAMSNNSTVDWNPANESSLFPNIKNVEINSHLKQNIVNYFNQIFFILFVFFFLTIIFIFFFHFYSVYFRVCTSSLLYQG